MSLGVARIGRRRAAATRQSRLRDRLDTANQPDSRRARMPRHRKLLAATAALATAAAVVGGIAASSARSAPAEHAAATVASATGCTSSRGTLKYGIAGAGISQLDPNTINFAGQAPLQTLLYNGLAKYDRNMQVIPDLATRWRVVEGPEDVVLLPAQGREVRDRPEVHRRRRSGEHPPCARPDGDLAATREREGHPVGTGDQPLPDPVQARQPERDPPERARRHQDERHAERRDARQQRHRAPARTRWARSSRTSR